jgi:hypothetical protein
MTEMKRMSRPMVHADWAWVTTCVAFGLFFATLTLLSEIGDARPLYGIKQTIAVANGQPVAAKVEPVVVPTYSTRITIFTNGNTQQIIQAAHDADPNIETSISSNHPRMRVWEYLLILFGSTMIFMLLSYTFRIMEKIFARLLHLKANK